MSDSYTNIPGGAALRAKHHEQNRNISRNAALSVAGAVGGMLLGHAINKHFAGKAKASKAKHGKRKGKGKGGGGGGGIHRDSNGKFA